MRVSGAAVDGFADLEGPESSWNPADVAHWSDVYGQLITFCQGLLSAGDAKDDLDRAQLRRRLEHFEARAAYWRAAERRSQP